MMDSKYYTPEIEEFHVGFEYEQCPFKVEDSKKDKWSVVRKFVYPDGVHNYTKIHGIEALELPIKEQCVRVKYLDREDIESLGYHTEDNGECYNKSEGFTLVGLYPWEKPNEYKITIELNDVFLGIIKNKSELKRLLKQLGI